MAAATGRSQVPAEFDSVGAMLKFLRRRARLTQRELGLRVGYTEGHISRLEHDQRPADVATLAALFVPALGLQSEPGTATRLIELATAARRPRGAGRGVTPSPSPPGGRSAAPGPTIPSGPPDAVRRTATLAALRARLVSEQRLAVCGLPGMGKTTLAAALAQEWVDRADVCWITLTDGVNATSDAVIRTTARFLIDRGHQEPAAILGAADTAVPLTLDEQLAVLALALSRRPVLLCLDNVHVLREDARANAVLRHLFATSSVSAVLTSRVEPGIPGLAVHRVHGLEAHEAAEVVARSGVRLPPGVGDGLVRRTAGSPMLLRLALGQLRHGGVDPAGLVDRLEHQSEVSDYLLTTTLAGLSRDARNLLSLLATLRAPVDLGEQLLVDLLHACDDRLDVPAGLRELQARYLVDHAAEADLHPLVRDHVYAHLASDPPRRRRLHRLAADWSRAADQVLDEVHHRLRAGDPEAAARLLVAEVATLAARGEAEPAADLARELLARARAGVGAPGLVPELLLARGDLLAGGLRAAEAEDAYRQAYAEADETARPWIACRLAECLLQRGRPAEAAELCAATATQVDPGHASVTAELAAVSAQAHHNLSRFTEARACAEQALAAAAAAAGAASTGGAPADLAAVRARAHHVLGQVLRVLGQHAEATRELQTAIDVATRAARPGLANRARYTMAAVMLEQGDLDAAADLFTSVAEAMAALGDSYGHTRALQAISQTHLSRGALELALETIERARSIRAQLADLEGLAAADCVWAEVLLALGRVDEARDLIEQVAGSPTAVGSWQRAYHLGTLGIVHLVAGETERARTAFATALALDGIEGTAIHLHVEICQALAGLVAGDPTEAQELAARRPEATAGAIPPGILLDLFALYVALAHDRQDRAGAARWAAEMARQALRTGRRRYLEVADRLVAAGAAGGRLSDVPRLVWSR